jgi:ATP/maltotriose-dependent transcriptional regulator MalT
MPPRFERLIGRGAELGLIERSLTEVERGEAGALALVGEPGIGKTRLLAELGARAEARGGLVLSGSATELERDLPFSAFVDAIDDYVASVKDVRLSGLEDGVLAELAHVFPSLSGLGRGRALAVQQERYRTHRAVRSLLERLAEPRPLVLLLDDVHWADSATNELLGALLRKPPGAAVLLAIALRPRQVAGNLSAALERAERTESVLRISLEGLTRTEATELLAGRVGALEVQALYEDSGGNPFYLQQLARGRDLQAGASDARRPAERVPFGVPPAVAASLHDELCLLTGTARLVLDGAAVAGDPFEPDIAAAAADVSEAAAMDSIDELLRVDLVRETEVPRRFRFRHPIVRRAVYEATVGGWRLRAHERCAAALAERGATAAVRAHHVERSARDGDLAAVAVLREAGEAAARLAPESAARWFGAGLRLLPHRGDVDDRLALQLLQADALAAAGHFDECHDVLLAAIELAPTGSARHAGAVAACARVERFLGQYEQAHARLVAGLSSMPDGASPESVALLIELTLNEFYRSRYGAMLGCAERATAAATALGDPALLASALAMPALAYAVTGPIDTARMHWARAAVAVDALPDEALGRRVDGPAWLAAAELYLDLYAEADAHASRSLAVARASGKGDPLFGLYQILPRVWYVRGKLVEAAELLDGGIEASRLLGVPPALAGNLFNRSIVALAMGDLELAFATAEEAFEISGQLDPGFVTGWAAVRLANVLLETGQPARALDLLLARAGGDELALIPGGWRAFCLELLARCWLAVGRHDEAAAAAIRAQSVANAMPLPLAIAWADRAAADVALEVGDFAGASNEGLASAESAEAAGAPLEGSLSRLVAGRALARAGDRSGGVAQLELALATFVSCGAARYRQLAERELGRLGATRPRGRRRASPDGPGLTSLTERELEVARLVVDRRTNAEIAAELFVSHKTVEAHLRNIFNKLDVAKRADLARAIERADRVANSTGNATAARRDG